MNWKIWNTPSREGSKASNGFKACSWIKNVCSKHSLKFVKRKPVFYLFRPGELGGQQYQSSRTMAQKMLYGDRGNWLGPKQPIGN